MSSRKPRNDIDKALVEILTQAVEAQQAVRTAIACLRLRDPRGALAVLEAAEDKRRLATEADDRT